MHSVTSTPSAGALITTLRAPALRWSAAFSRAVNRPVDSITTSTLSSFHGSLAGSRSAIHAEGVAVEHDLIALGLDLMLERAVYRVMLEQMGERRGVGDVVDRDDLDLFLVQHRPKSHPADSAETVDSDPDRHSAILPEGLSLSTRNGSRLDKSPSSKRRHFAGQVTANQIYHNFRQQVGYYLRMAPCATHRFRPRRIVGASRTRETPQSSKPQQNAAGAKAICPRPSHHVN